MIVKCEQCQTRFKIPDEKVTDKGVKVRCTKCGHTFRVTRDMAASASGTHATVAPAAPVATAPPAANPGFDPFERFGPAPDPPKGVHTTRPGFFAEGVEASRAPAPPAVAPPPPAPWNSADSGMEEDAFHETTRVIPLQVPTEARPPVPSLPPVSFPGQGQAGPGGVSFRPSAPSAVPLPGIPSVAPSVSPTPLRAPVAAPAKPAATKPLSGPAPRALAPSAFPVPTGPANAVPASAPRPAARPAVPTPAPVSVPGAADLFTEFFASPPGGAQAPLPQLPPPGLAPVAPPPAWPAAPSPSFAPPDDDPFGSVSGDLSEPPPDLGPPPEFDPTAAFSDPEPVAPPPPPPRPLPVARPASPPTPAMGRQSLTPAPVAGRLAGTSPVPIAPPAPAARMSPVPLPPVPSGSPFADEDPFGPPGGDASPATDDFGFGVAPAPAPVFEPPAPAPASMGFSEDDPFGAPGGDFGGGHEEQTIVATGGHFEAATPAPGGFEEFGPSFGAPAPQEQAPQSLPDPGFAPPSNMDFGMIGDDQMPQAADPMADPFAAQAEDPFAAPDQGAGMADPFAAQAADPFAAPDQGAGAADPYGAQAADPYGAQAADPYGAQAADPFAAQASAQGMADPFAAAESGFNPTATGRQMLGSGDASEGYLTQTDTSHRTISPTDTGRQLLDLPQQDPSQPGPGEEFGVPSSSRELIDLPVEPAAPAPAPAPAPRPAPTLAAAAIARPAGRPADMGIPERRKLSAAQQVTGQVAYLTIAAGLLLALTAVGGVYMKEGRVDAAALSPGHLMQLLTPSQLAPRSISNGLYDTRAGAAVFYVRGEAENRGSKPMRVKVRAALYDGDQRVKSVEGLAGLAPTPEDLYAVINAETAAQLRTRLDAGATLVAPGARAPFTLVFQEYPQELSAYRLQVTMEPAPEEGSKP
jgi:predicted Zn finger-like uncharacterized protein